MTFFVYFGEIMKEFLGFGGYERTPEGAYSWQHLLLVGIVLAAMIGIAVWLGLVNRHKDAKSKNRVLIWTAILIDALEIFKIVVMCMRSDDPSTAWHGLLPLFLCSIQLITIPVAAFTRGIVKDAALDFVLIFGILGAILGTIGAAQNYNAYPVLSLDNVVSALTHSISGFASLYIAISGMASMKKRNIPITYSILGVFCGAAFITNKILDANYMFLESDDGTPYSLLTSLVGGNPVLYAIGVVVLFLIYITGFYLIFRLCTKKSRK